MSPNAYEHVVDPCDKVYDGEGETTSGSDASTTKEKVPVRIVWESVIVLMSLYPLSLYGGYLAFTSAKWQTNVFAIFVLYSSFIGVTAGAHRLWTHRTYKAKLPLRILLAFLFIIAGQKDIYAWSREHRLHHKYSDTDADPHNAKRGFFFSHIGWVMCRKHPEVLKKGKSLDMTDVLADPVVRFQKKYYLPLFGVCSFILPTVMPMYFWNETFHNALMVCGIFRYYLSINLASLVNSVAHTWGNRPYDTKIEPRENVLVTLAVGGEGFHNYHHAFPYDYSTSEYGLKYNLTTAFIDLMALFGLANDRKTASKESIMSRKLRTGEDILTNQQANLKREFVKEE